MKNKEIEEFDKKQLEELLKRLKDINNFIGFKDGAFKYYLGKYEADLLLSYIEQLKKQAELGEHYKHLYSEVKKQKDDVVKLIYKKMRDVDIYGTQTFDLDEILRMLGEINE